MNTGMHHTRIMPAHDEALYKFYEREARTVFRKCFDEEKKQQLITTYVWQRIKEFELRHEAHQQHYERNKQRSKLEDAAGRTP